MMFTTNRDKSCMQLLWGLNWMADDYFSQELLPRASFALPAVLRQV
jgi:hypothetical protein